ncbi:MAG: alpha/beta hydrolase [Rhodoferax sp.]|nr:alpha/beta hydrolase [Rhodoferax sp.]
MTKPKAPKKSGNRKPSKASGEAPGRHVRATDIAGYGKLALDATLGVVDMMGVMHRKIVDTPGVLESPLLKAVSEAADLVLGGIRDVAHSTREGVDRLVKDIAPDIAQMQSSAQREAVVSAFNGVVGDHLASSSNPLTITMRLRQNGQALELSKPALQAMTATTAAAPISGKILLLVHGSCMNDLQWMRKNHDHGAALAAAHGFTAVYLHYNSGLHISSNGRQLASLLQELVHAWPTAVQELVIVAHSMGGLVSRSACHYAQQTGLDWLSHLSRMVFLGTPHHGAPLERGGNWVTILLEAMPSTSTYAGLAKIRSSGVTDLRHGSLLDEDWAEGDRFAHSTDLPGFVALPAHVKCYAVGAVFNKELDNLGATVLGDGMVPLNSALGRHADPQRCLDIPDTHQATFYGLNHLDLLNHPDVFAQLQRWLVES